MTGVGISNGSFIHRERELFRNASRPSQLALGVGLDPSTPSWGTMLNDGRDYLLTAWWISTMPGIAIGFTVLGVMFLGEGLRELLDPRGSR